MNKLLEDESRTKNSITILIMSSSPPNNESVNNYLDELRRQKKREKRHQRKQKQKQKQKQQKVKQNLYLQESVNKWDGVVKQFQEELSEAMGEHDEDTIGQILFSQGLNSLFIKIRSKKINMVDEDFETLLEMVASVRNKYPELFIK